MTIRRFRSRAVFMAATRLLPDWIVIDWDELMLPAGWLAGFPIRDNEALWKPYEALVK